MLDACKRIIRQKNLCVLATAGLEGPHCSLMAYVPDDPAQTLFCVTQRNTRKYKNMQASPKTSLLLDTRDEHQGPERRNEMQALTLRCLAQELTGPDRDRVLRLLARRHPQLEEIVNDPDAAVMALDIREYQLLTGATNMFRHVV